MICHHFLVLAFCKCLVIKLEFSILRIVGVINQRMRPSLATGECQIPNASDYPILPSCVPFLEINLLPQNSKENNLQLINIVPMKISQIPFQRSHLKAAFTVVCFLARFLKCLLDFSIHVVASFLFAAPSPSPI